MREPPNKVRNELMKQELDELEKHGVANNKENIICKILTEYAYGFSKIFRNLAATLTLMGIFARIWETSTS